MKRGHEENNGEDSREPPAKRRPLPHALSIVSRDTRAVRETYLTDGEIVATGGSGLPRVFPINRIIVGAWSETFRVMINGNFSEGATARVELPYSEEVVAIAVQHMYFLVHFADAPAVLPEKAFEVLQLAHMHEQRDLFERAEKALWESNTFHKDTPGNVSILRTLLSLGVNFEDLVCYYFKSDVVFPPFSIDVHDEVLRPFWTDLFEHPIRRKERLMVSEYTEEMRINNAYDLCLPEVWDVFMKELREKFLAGEDPRITERYMRYMDDVARYSAITHCGVRSMEQIVAEIEALRRRRDVEENVLDEMLWVGFTQDDDSRAPDMYQSLMRRLYPLPALPPPSSASHSPS